MIKTYKEFIKWIVGLTDSTNNPVGANFFKFASHEDAKRALDYILNTYDGVERGPDYGNKMDMTIVYMLPEPI